MRCLVLSLFCLSTSVAFSAGPEGLQQSLLFHASFDKSADADFAKGDRRVYTAMSLKRSQVELGMQRAGLSVDASHGRYGGALHFTEKTTELLFYRGRGNLPQRTKGFSGTFCLWLRVAPNEQLPAGFVDPLQITDKKWNDASFFLDFTKELPRQFRLGVFSDYKFWNPTDRKWEEIPDVERPLVGVAKPPFRGDAWTHVAVTFHHFNNAGEKGVARLFLDGKSVGALQREQQFTWDPAQLAIMLGINYVGYLDDLAIFDRPLSETEITALLKLPAGVASLRP